MLRCNNWITLHPPCAFSLDKTRGWPFSKLMGVFFSFKDERSQNELTMVESADVVLMTFMAWISPTEIFGLFPMCKRSNRWKPAPSIMPNSMFTNRQLKNVSTSGSSSIPRREVLQSPLALSHRLKTKLERFNIKSSWRAHRCPTITEHTKTNANKFISLLESVLLDFHIGLISSYSTKNMTDEMTTAASTAFGR